MANAVQASTMKVRCRPIAAGDRDGLAALLARGFPARTQAAWSGALGGLARYAADEGHPHHGYVLDAGGTLVGVLLMIFGPRSEGPRRCNLSSWYVEAGYRHYASLLVGAATRDRSVTYLNLSSERATRPIIEAQGFVRYADGAFLALPLAGPASEAGLCIAAAGHVPAGAAEADRALIETHAGLGCIALWGVAEGEAHPFVFARRTLTRLRIPVAQVIHAPGEAELRRFARPLGRHLLLRGLPVLMVDANGPVPGLVGRYLPGRMPKYAKGSQPPRHGDLAYTEAAFFGT
ncbi:hypothetical protein [Methylobacterium sp. A54F]